MKLVKSIFFLSLVVIVFFSCAKTTSSEAKIAVKETKEMAVNLKKVSLDIEGMTCQIGCAKTIQSKLAKTEGVNYVLVNFEEKKGIVEYDTNLLSEKDIVKTVEKIAGGDLYKVTEVAETE